MLLGVLLLAPLQGAVGTDGLGAAAAAPAEILVSAHRGGAAYAPENTMPAFRNAVRLGVDELETDTQLTRDGRLVLVHDDTLERTTSCTGTVGSRTLAELQRCDAGYWWTPGQAVTTPRTDAPHPHRGSGVTIPTADELFSYVRSLGAQGPRVSIEIKDIPGESNFDPAGTAVAAVLVPLIQSSGVADRTTVQSFFPTALEAVRRLDPSIRTQFLTTSSTGQTAAQNVVFTTARGYDVAAPNFDAPDFDAAVVATAHAAGRQVIPYTVDRRADIERIAATGVDGIITNYPACALAALGRPVPAVPDACPGGGAAVGADRPSAETCRTRRAPDWRPATGHADLRGDLRVVALQFAQDVRHVETYADFRTTMRCLVETFVVPHQRPGVPTLAVFNEDIGLMTIAVGSRGALVREQARTPLRAPAGDAAPLGVGGALGALNTAYAPQVAAYQAMLGPIDPRKQVLVAATDTFARAYSQTLSDIARDYGIYVVASNNQAPYRATTDPAEVALFADPDLRPTSVAYVATSQRVANVTSLWGPRDVAPSAPAGRRNLLFENEKVPLTPIEKDLLALDEGPSTGPAARRNAAGVVVAGHRLGFATSLPAFTWGYPLGKRPAGLDPCADTTKTYMPCMDALGVDTVVQAEANPGRWTQLGGRGQWQPLEWMDSTWRTVADPTVRFRYNITAHLVGNLLDLPFDGQSAITMRGYDGPLRHYVGNRAFTAEDDENHRVYAGGKREFLALAPWVTPDADRDALRATGARLAPGSGDPLENRYVETALYADLLPATATPAPPTAPPTAPTRGAPAATPDRLPDTGGLPAMLPVAVLGAAAVLRRSLRR